MDRKNLKKSEAIEKKIEKRDRGDLKKERVKKFIDCETNVELPNSEGDTVKKTINKNNSRNPEELKRKEYDDKTVETDLIQGKTNKDERRKIRERYTLKLKHPNVVPVSSVRKEEGVKTVGKINLDFNKIERPARKPKDKSDSTQTFKSSWTQNRRPLINTITSRNDSTKIFKSVTFVDQKRTVPLQVKIPNEKQSDESKPSKTTLLNKASSTCKEIEKSILIKRNRQKKRKKSPKASRVKTPVTEVAKWAPSSVDHHTKPYYEAWVSTTLAAISKATEEDKKLIEQQNFLQTFQKTFTRPESPDLWYEKFADERYTGRIKVRQR